MISFKTIYHWIYVGDLNALRPKGKHRKPCGRFNIETSIPQHPKEVKNREMFGIGK